MDHEPSYPQMYLYRRIVQAKLFIDAHYPNALDLNDIADEACFSKFHFIRQFKRIYHKTPHQYLVAVRMQQALLLLQKGWNATEVCYAVGFESPGSFSTLFKKHFSITPGESQLNYRHLQYEIQSQPLRFIPGCYAFMNSPVV